jgi:hypothetical protein
MVTVKKASALSGKLLILTCGVSLFVAQVLSAQERIKVQPSASLTWDQLLQSDPLQKAVHPRGPMVTPYMLGPVEAEINVPEAMRLSSRRPAGLHETHPIPIGVESLSFAAATLGFKAVSDNNMAIPPNAQGAVGPSHVMTMLNTEVQIQSKTGAVRSTMSLASFWASMHGTPFDPRLLYDKSSGRWIASCDANPWSDSSKVFFAISSSNDPTGLWSFYSIDADPGDTVWADYTCLGFNSKWIVITSNMFRFGSSTPFRGPGMWVIDKSTVLAGGALTVTVFPPKFDLAAGISSSTLQPCVTFGEESKFYLVDRSPLSFGETRLLRISELSGSASTPVWRVCAGSTILPASGLFAVANNFDFFQAKSPQKGTSTRIETADARILNAVFRDGKIWCTHTGGLPVGNVDRTVVLWYQLDPVQMAVTGDPVVQSGVLQGGPGVHHFFPSIAVNAAGDVCIGFSRSDDSKFVEAAYTGRWGTDPPNTMHSISVLKMGQGVYRKTFGASRVRWGDYSATVIDPTDDLTFWTIQEYADSSVGPTPNDDRWGTWWGKVVPVTALSAVEVTTSAFPKGFVLTQNYPNPFNPSTLIEFAVPQTGLAVVKVYSVLGQEVATLFNADAEAGRMYRAQFDGANLPSGVYWYSLKSAGRIGTKRMLLLK